jgi:predicted SPOUT superfamily RNA methylase MTH1
MKALSIHQPWAWLIIHGGKDIENRRWNCHHRGTLYIHASKKRDELEYLEAWNWARKHVDPDIRMPHMQELQYGGVIGRVKMVDSVKKHESKWFTGPYGFVFKFPKKTDYYPVSGQQGLFNVDIEEKRKDLTRRQLMAARARAMKGVRVTFRLDANDPKSRVGGMVIGAKVGKVHEPSNLLGYEVKVQGASGKIVTIDSNERFMKIHWDTKR